MNDTYYTYYPSNEKVFIIDAHSMWIKNRDIIFVPAYRLAGNITILYKYLSQSSNLIDANLKDLPKISDLSQLTKISITFDNYQNNPLYKEELDNYWLFRQKIIDKNLKAPGFNIMDLILRLNSEKYKGLKEKEIKQLGLSDVKSAMSIIKSGNVSKVSKVSKFRGLSLDLKIRELTEDKVLDVSNLTENGTGARTINKPKNTNKSSKFSLPNIPIVSSSFEKFILALTMLPGGLENYKQEIDYLRQIFNYDGPLPVFNVEQDNSENLQDVDSFNVEVNNQVDSGPGTQAVEVPRSDIITPVKIAPIFNADYYRQLKIQQQIKEDQERKEFQETQEEN